MHTKYFIFISKKIYTKIFYIYVLEMNMFYKHTFFTGYKGVTTKNHAYITII